MGGGADDPSYSSFGSRWGIKGSSEVSEGLTSVYKFETRIGQGKASQDTNQLYVGLSGGFGNVTLGKQVGAVYNHTGAIRDISNWHSGGDVGSRISNALSYSYAAESFSMQVAAIMDGGEDADTDGAVDRMEFGMTVSLGDIGKVAIGYEKQEDSMKDGDAVAVTPSMGEDEVALTLKDGALDKFGDIVWRSKDMRKIVTGTVSDVVHTYVDYGTDGNKATADDNMMYTVTPVVVMHDATAGDATDYVATDTIGNGVSSVTKVGEKYYASSCVVEGKAKSGCTDKMESWLTVKYQESATTKTGTNPDPAYSVVNQDADGFDVTHAAMVTPTDTTYGHKASHISASFGLAGITVALGHTTKDSNNPMMSDKMKTNFLGASGSIGDTGMSWNAWGRNVDGHDGKETSPWTVGLAKSLGGGATTFIEHTNADDGEDGTTSIALRVDF